MRHTRLICIIGNLILVVLSFDRSVVDVDLLVDDELDVSYFMVSCDLREEARDSEGHVLFLKSVGLPMLSVHAAVVYDVLHHLVDHVG
jgi:hypothetical protein